MGDPGKPVGFGDPMYAMMLVGRVWAHERLREVNHSPAAFEEGLRKFVSTTKRKFRDVPGISEISEYWYVHSRSTGCP